ncbi:hypothetical protein Goarm_017099 [Gossypium armourianum]|uniref:DUF4283 domain-containing protein n=1 Tax=Gossypium armourianum TaxID=34283 RepID=A0A7J9JEB7_9ROSI|nr:hypothetical protein [Gossypium armourianum]
MEISLNTEGGGSSLEAGRDDGPRDDLDRNTKKVRFKEDNGNGDIDMMVESNSIPTMSWKDKLLGNGLGDKGKTTQILFKEMETTVVLKLLGSIGYLALNNRVSSLWRPSKPFHLMDIENKYFLPKFQCTEDFEEVLSQGPCLVYRQYLTVQPWTKEFNPSQPYLSMVMAWIYFPGLLEFLYKRRVLEEIGGTIGKPLVSQVLVNSVLQRVEYESLPTIRYTCGKYGHTKEICPLKERISMVEKERTDSASDWTATKLEGIGIEGFKAISKQVAGMKGKSKEKMDEVTWELLQVAMIKLDLTSSISPSDDLTLCGTDRLVIQAAQDTPAWKDIHEDTSIWKDIHEVTPPDDLEKRIDFVKGADLVNGEKNKGEWVTLKPNGKGGDIF